MAWMLGHSPNAVKTFSKLLPPDTNQKDPERGARLAQARIDAGFTQRQAAAKANLPHTSLSSWENGAPISEGKLDALCAIYGANKARIRYGDSVPPPDTLQVRETGNASYFRTSVALGISQRVRVFIEEFLLEQAKLGVPDEEIQGARRILRADELHRKNWGGESPDYTDDEILEGVEAHAEAFRKRWRKYRRAR